MIKRLVKCFIFMACITFVGCSGKDENVTIDSVESNREVIESVSDEKNQILFKQYENLAPRVKEVLEEYGLKVILENSEYVEDYDHYTRILVIGPKEPGNYSRIIFELYTGTGSAPEYIVLSMEEYLDSDMIEERGYKFEDTLNYRLATILLGDNLDYSDTNSKITEIVNNRAGGDIIKFDHGNVKEKFEVDYDFIKYIITVLPEE